MYLRQGMAVADRVGSWRLAFCAAMALSLKGGVGNSATAAELHVPAQFPDIQSAVAASINGDEIIVSDGTYTGPGNKNIDFGGRNIAVRSAGGPALCMIDLEDSGRAFYLHSGEGAGALIEGFTISNGKITSAAMPGGAFGAGICLDGVSPTIRNCVFNSNSIATDGSKGGGGVSTTGGSAVIQDCVFTNNSVDGSRSSSLAGAPIQGGGGLLIHETVSTVVENCQFNANICEGAGGGIALNSNASILNCTFTGNIAHDGGGLMIESSSPSVNHCTFDGNSSTVLGGAIYHDHGSPDVRFCTFINNSSQGGGAIESFAGNLKVRLCVFRENQGTSGGALRTYQGLSSVIDCAFIGNTSTGQGGAMRVYLGISTIVSCTIVGNAAAFGGAISAGEFGKPDLVNCVLWDNAAPTGPQMAMELGSRGSQIKVHHCNVQAGEKGVFVGPGKLMWGVGNISAEPLFVEPAGPDNDPLTFGDNNYRIGAGSPCIDAGDNAACPLDLLLDLDDNPRYFDDPATTDSGKASGGAAIVDMGAFEYQGLPGDVNHDGVVNVDDLMMIIVFWGTCEVPLCSADLTGNNIIDCDDLLIVINNWS
jgi:predicted outer membrane repeat protein